MFYSTRTVKTVLFKTEQGPINGCEFIVTRHCKFSSPPLWKRKPICCPHDVSIIWPSLLVVTGQGLALRGPLLNSPCLLPWFIAHNDGYTEDYFTYSNTIAGTLSYLVPNTCCLKVSDYILCPSGCCVMLWLPLVLKNRIMSNLLLTGKVNRFSSSHTHFFLVMYFNKMDVE